MTDEKDESKDLNPDPVPEDYDIAHLMQYSGPSFRQQEPFEPGVKMFDFRNTDENERAISILLSSQGIKFHLERPELGWPRSKIRMIITVPKDQYRQASAVLAAAAKAKVVDIVEGTEGLISY